MLKKITLATEKNLSCEKKHFLRNLTSAYLLYCHEIHILRKRLDAFSF